jgi:hypothetical protein
VVRFQLVIDCAEPDRLARFWASALHYQLEPAPDGFDSWDDYYRDLGVGEEDLGIGEDSIVDPHAGGPRIWFQRVPDRKTVKNRADSVGHRNSSSLSRCAGVCQLRVLRGRMLSW